MQIDKVRQIVISDHLCVQCVSTQRSGCEYSVPF